MSRLNYVIKGGKPLINTAEVYQVKSIYDNASLKDAFARLRAHFITMDGSGITKSITGTEQDFINLMGKAKEFLRATNVTTPETVSALLSMFQDCVFGYYILTPLIDDPLVSDIKVLSYDHIVCKVNGKRYITNICFDSERDYDAWYDRRLRILKLDRSDDATLQDVEDIQGSSVFNLRVDFESKRTVATNDNNIHIRKSPKEKYNWDYLITAGMLDEEIIECIRDLMRAGYGFILNGKGGSGKTALLNNILDIHPFDESVLVAQDDGELYTNIHPQVQVENTVKVLKEGKRETLVSLDDILTFGLLQDIDAFMVGEIKGKEALHIFITAAATGARCSCSTHADSNRDAVRRLVNLAKLGSDYSIEALEEMIALRKMVLIHLDYFKITEITEIAGWDADNRRIIYRDILEKKK